MIDSPPEVIDHSGIGWTTILDHLRKRSAERPLLPEERLGTLVVRDQGRDPLVQVGADGVAQRALVLLEHRWQQRRFQFGSSCQWSSMIESGASQHSRYAAPTQKSARASSTLLIRVLAVLDDQLALQQGSSAA